MHFQILTRSWVRSVALAATLAIPLTAATEEVQELSIGDVIRETEAGIVVVRVMSESGEAAGQGSGFVVDAEGGIATCYHVVNGAAKAEVSFSDGTKREVESIRQLDRDADLAVLKLKGGLPEKAKAIRLSGDAPPKEGTGVVAIGHPQGFNFTTTSGIVSAVRATKKLPAQTRRFLSAADDVLWVQSSAAISGGNSGGPLLNRQAEVVGVNAWVADGENLGFAVHVSRLRKLLATEQSPVALGAEESSKDVHNPLNQLQPRVQRLTEEFLRARQEFQILLADPKNRFRVKDISAKEDPAPRYARRFLELAKSKPGTLTSLQSLALALDLSQQPAMNDCIESACKALVAGHVEDRGLLAILPRLASKDHGSVPETFRAIIDKSPHRDLKGAALVFLAQNLNAKKPADEAEILGLLGRCKNEFADVQFGEQDLGTIAEQLMFKVQYLTVGKKAPDLEGKDVEGNSFKLSDFQGKVVLLDFFADWCPHCRRMYPHERTMVKKYADKPFALVGVNCESEETLRELVKTQAVTWRCWADGQGGPLATKWQVEAFPTIYLIDAEGVIREIISGAPDKKTIEKRIDDLLPKSPDEPKDDKAG